MAAEAGGEINLRVLTLNCWGIRYVAKQKNERFRAIGDELAKGNYDIVALQEVWDKADYENLVNVLQEVLPFAHYFYSGVIGSGVCIFSRWPIVESNIYTFSANGYFYCVTHGDWFGGKSVGYCKVAHPVKHLNCFSAHLHAAYGDEEGIYLSHRTVQAYQLSQFVSQFTRPDEPILLMGDFNTEEGQLCHRLIKDIPHLRDCWVDAGNKEKLYGNTCDISTNSFTSVEIDDKIKGGPLDGCRIDYIFYRPGNNSLKCVECAVTMGRIPGKSFNYSDHEGVEASFIVTEGGDDNMTLSDTDEYDYKSPGERKQQALSDALKVVSAKLKSFSRSQNEVFMFCFLFLLAIFAPLVDPSFTSRPAQVVSSVASVSLVCCIWYFVVVKRTEYHVFKNVEQDIKNNLKYLEKLQNLK